MHLVLLLVLNTRLVLLLVLNIHLVLLLVLNIRLVLLLVPITAAITSSGAKRPSECGRGPGAQPPEKFG